MRVWGVTTFELLTGTQCDGWVSPCRMEEFGVTHFSFADRRHRLLILRG